MWDIVVICGTRARGIKMQCRPTGNGTRGLPAGELYETRLVVNLLVLHFEPACFYSPTFVVDHNKSINNFGP